MSPTSFLCTWLDTEGRETWRQYHDETDPLPDSWDDVPHNIEPLYTATQIRLHNEAAEVFSGEKAMISRMAMAVVGYRPYLPQGFLDAFEVAMRIPE